MKQGLLLVFLSCFYFGLHVSASNGTTASSPTSSGPSTISGNSSTTNASSTNNQNNSISVQQSVTKTVNPSTTQNPITDGNSLTTFPTSSISHINSTNVTSANNTITTEKSNNGSSLTIAPTSSISSGFGATKTLSSNSSIRPTTVSNGNMSEIPTASISASKNKNNCISVTIAPASSISIGFSAIKTPSSNNSMRTTAVSTTYMAELPTASISTFKNKNNSRSVTVASTSNNVVTYSTSGPTPTMSATPTTSTVTTPRNVEPLVIEVSLKFGKWVFHEDLNNQESLRFLETKKEVEGIITSAYKDTDNFISVTITGFRHGSIVSDGRLYFENSSDNDIAGFNKTLSDYGKNYGNFTVSNLKRPIDNGDNDDDDDDDDDVILGLNWWQIGLIIAAFVALVLLITVIVLCCKISKAKTIAHGNMSPYLGGPFYETVGDSEEMKTLRATPPEGKNGEVESGHQKINMYSSTSTSDVKNDTLVLKTNSNLGEDNAGVEVNEYDYVTIVEPSSGPGDVVKL